MAGKRTATSDLNHTNWEEEEESEDAGTFTKAPEEVIKNRVIKIAKRRNPIGSSSSDEEKKNTFANLSGFGKPGTTSSSAFSFLSNLTNKTEEQPKSNGLNDISTNASKPMQSIKPMFEKPSIVKEADIEKSGKPKEYYAKIKGLNQSVSKWIQKHVDTNPFLNLTPIFRDYEKYLEDIESLSVHTESTSKIREIKNVTTTTLKISEETVSPKPTLTSAKATPELTSEPKSQFSFGSSSSTTTNKLSFGKPETSTAGFSFASGTATKPFTFSNVTQLETTAEEKKEEDEDVPPKVEFTPVIEKDHIFTIRCKVFVKKDENFGDRGVGNLFLKPVPDSDKVQLIVRADTNLGHLTCNFILSKSIPTQRLGKKDVMLVCLPTPEHKPPPVPVLFRVKSSEDADELLAVLEKHKK